MEFMKWTQVVANQPGSTSGDASPASGPSNDRGWIAAGGAQAVSLADIPWMRSFDAL